MTLMLIAKLEGADVLRKGMARAPPRSEMEVHPEDNEVIVFRDFFTVGLRFPVTSSVGSILQLIGIKLHQLTPNAFVRLNLFF